MSSLEEQELHRLPAGCREICILCTPPSKTATQEHVWAYIHWSRRIPFLAIVSRRTRAGQGYGRRLDRYWCSIDFRRLVARVL